MKKFHRTKNNTKQIQKKSEAPPPTVPNQVATAPPAENIYGVY